MCCGGRRNMRGAPIAERRQIESVEEMLAGPEQPGRDGEVQLVDQPCFEILANRRYPAADLHVFSVRCFLRAFHRLASTARHEVKRRAAFHLDWRARVMCQ